MTGSDIGFSSERVAEEGVGAEKRESACAEREKDQVEHVISSWLSAGGYIANRASKRDWEMIVRK
jgi:hypothetical protein